MADALFTRRARSSCFPGIPWLGVMILSLGMVVGCSEGDAGGLAVVELEAEASVAIGRFDGRWLNLAAGTLIEVDATDRTLAVELPVGATLDFAHAVDRELRIGVTWPNGAHHAYRLRIVDTDLLMIVPAGDSDLEHATLAERTSRLEEVQYRLLDLAERSAMRLDDRLDRIIRKL